MTLAEAAILLGIAPSTLRRQAERFPWLGQKRGRDWWFTPVMVARYQRDHLGKPGRKPIPR